ncbi:hypothetical protein BGZ61DRAFT_130693 [Ilyonectria robusta]|uniref:uncharacterized protein n=1 Tax=Ilyonectria robusta TaxID=1079257 RepID=UPI001E8E59E6|nr:uncharacterized protein BGZ61DRAFT_130693 [Ilyonectria robusta]KAH8734843.1 hypothetical protein BGZ61DRAFT_130693 [Ilyonectria robusta]
MAVEAFHTSPLLPVAHPQRDVPTTPCDHFGIISARRNRKDQGPHSFTHSVTPSPCFSLPSRLPGPHGLRHSYAPDSGRRGEAINLSRALARLEMAICLKIIIFDTTHRYPPRRPQESNDCQPVASAKNSNSTATNSRHCRIPNLGLTTCIWCDGAGGRSR